MQVSLSSLVKSIQADARFRRLVNLFEESPLYKIPFKQLHEEIESLHRTRPVRILNRDDPRFIEKIVDASIRDQSYRSRLTEISVQCYRSASSLQDALDAMRSHILFTFSSQMKVIRTKDERLQVIDLAMAPLLKHVRQCDRLKTTAEMVIGDIDKAAWSLKLLVSSYELHSRPEQRI